MSQAPLLFIDTETTGLEPDADVWEFAGVRRNPDGTSRKLHLFIEHDPAKCAKLPESFREDHRARFPGCGGERNARSAANAIWCFAAADENDELPVWVGSNPQFDISRLERLCASFGGLPQINHHPIDVVPLMLGYLASVSREPLPYKSEELSRILGVNPDDFARHTAMGDVEWVIAIWDKINEAGA